MQIERESCPRCNGGGIVFIPWLNYNVICVRCEGSGAIIKQAESLRDFRKRIKPN